MIISYKTASVLEKVGLIGIIVVLVCLIVVPIPAAIIDEPIIISDFAIAIFSLIVAAVTNSIESHSELVPDDVLYLMKQGYTKEEATNAWYESEIFFNLLKGGIK